VLELASKVAVALDSRREPVAANMAKEGMVSDYSWVGGGNEREEE